MHATYHDLKDSSVFITGGGSGIGAAITESFLAQGAKVAFVQRSDASEFVAEMKAKHGAAPLYIECDVTDVDALKAAIAQAGDAHGTITTLVNNAAWDNRHPVQGFTPDEWDSMMRVNLRPHFFGAQAVAPGMKEAGGGSIINFSSIAFRIAVQGFPAYATAKAGIVGLTNSMARELGPDFIRVNSVLPGWVLTKRQMDLWATEEALKEFLAMQCLPEHLHEKDIVGTVLFLASNSSRMMTGQSLVVDGGVTFPG
ncbi:SDR family NAD(P)-dependent oxidoreductase [Mariniblastus fucicola]|uniref:(S)-1-Phenylethanol dehydrogenase n=1 Tax=Mariniblastus fucicola TaxID=980251 RepID=A0A5B9P4W6_9BACT|nr:SDR family oxidoreductase [Mariniblastus fucicola]QEG21438.1 (S)-1-Phenylethanol dehydrogenase [Mariniblastus fucicola]